MHTRRQPDNEVYERHNPGYFPSRKRKSDWTRHFAYYSLYLGTIRLQTQIKTEICEPTIIGLVIILIEY